MSRDYLSIALKVFFAVVYFLVFWFLLDLLFRNTLSALANLGAAACLAVALVASIVLAHCTVEKIKDRYSK